MEGGREGGKKGGKERGRESDIDSHKLLVFVEQYYIFMYFLNTLWWFKVCA